MSYYEYRIEYSIQRAPADTDDFAEVGFGSSGSSGYVDDALHWIASDIQRRQWETEPGMPEPEEMERGA